MSTAGWLGSGGSLRSRRDVQLMAENGFGNPVTATNPVTWASGDRLNFTLVYDA